MSDHVAELRLPGAGDHQVEEQALRAESVVSVTCRWCGRGDAIEIVDRATADLTGDPSDR